MEKITVIINGQKLEGNSGLTILELAREYGIKIPTLCYSEKLKPLGCCRVCVVEIEGTRTLSAACHTLITPQMVIHTNSEKVQKVRQTILKLILSGHPDNCLVCDKSNLCELRQLLAEMNIGFSRMVGQKKYYALEDLNSYLVRDMSKCILCRRCVFACRDVKKGNIFNLGFRGFCSKIIVDNDQPLNKEICKGCDICVTVCPVGALKKVGGKKEGKPLLVEI